MQLTEHIHMVGSGVFGLSHPLDAHVYLVVAGEQAALVDAGAGLDTREANCP